LILFASISQVIGWEDRPIMCWAGC